MCVCVYLLNCVCVCVCASIKLHITAQFGPVILVILIRPSSYSFYATRIDPPKGGSMILFTETSDQTQQREHILLTVLF